MNRGQRPMNRWITPTSDSPFRASGTPYISEQAAVHLAQAGVRTVGVDYLSVGGYHADGPLIHRILLQAGIWIIEGLDLSPVTGGRYEMICLPVKLHGSDGAPARAILRPLSA
jgi:arylformamidase